MAEIIDLKAVRDTRGAEEEEAVGPTEVMGGPAKCLACGHEWLVENIPVGSESFNLVCPKCDMSRGQLQYPPTLSEGSVTWEHRCGSSCFTPAYLSEEGRIAVHGERELIRVAGRAKFRLALLCNGCGELVDPEAMGP